MEITDNQDQSDITNEIKPSNTLSWDNDPKLVATWKPNKELNQPNPNTIENFTPFFKWAKWSPDGSAILTNSSDHKLKMWHLNKTMISSETDQNSGQIDPFWTFQKTEPIFDLDWYPFQNYHDISTRCFIKSTKQHPIQLCNMDNGLSYENYIVMDDKEQLVTSQCIKFNPLGTKIYGGSLNMICIFDVNKPGKNGTNILTKPTKKSQEGQSGIISCIDFNTLNYNIFALGSYSNSIGLYDDRSLQLAHLIHSIPSGVTDLKFSSDGNYLFNGCRKDNWIYCWDIRNLHSPVLKMERPLTTHQRVYFDLTANSNELITGDEDGNIRIYKINEMLSNNSYDEEKISSIHKFKLHEDSIPICEIHPYLPLIFTCSGSKNLSDDRESEYTLKIWKLN